VRADALDEAALRAWGQRIGESVPAPLFIALRGDLGAGKSVLARAIARGAGVAATMPSPTYNLLFRYPAADGAEVVHLDLYRLERPQEVIELGWRELGAAHEIVVVEWPERAEKLLPPDRWEIRLHTVDALTRAVDAEPHGNVPALPSP
jgi:tRNA threonylcarbamoyladenosine biosynthesis protein TsaE